MIRDFYDSTDEDDMESQYQIDPECLVLTPPDKDMHNRCCGGKAWCIKDICGIICAVLTWLLILYAEFVVMMVMLLPSLSTYPFYSYVNIFIFQILAFLAFASHLRTMFTDPVSLPL
ncbi:palmitoyltransferase ZDHHC3 [Manduca sexta]|uniref:palmitoyltransferase ZDHHC3 n=1 Tax=Manduca sexta TaxID=7130 RepID=UPI00188DD1A5|nr:palmitoyltransferase ZDHHC3 [Manduca sexta]